MSTSSWGSGSEPTKPYRRRKKHEGATWSIDSASALKEDGVWCPHHHQRHGYKSSLLGFNPERWNGKSYIHWYCKTTGQVLDTVVLGELVERGSGDRTESTSSGNGGSVGLGSQEAAPEEEAQ